MRIPVLIAVAAALGWGSVASRALATEGSWDWSAEAASGGTLQFELRSPEGDRDAAEILAVPVERLEGLPTEAVATGSDAVRFRLDRDPGDIAFTGSFAPGRGGGIAEFLPDPGFLEALARLGAGPLTPRQLMTLAIHDVKLDGVRELADRGYRRLSFEQILRMLRPDLESPIPGWRTLLGAPPAGSGEVVSLRLHDPW